jgi:tetratricopeptide (TPR) repeat protein
MTLRPNVLAAGTTAPRVGRRFGRLPALLLWAGAGLGVLPGPAPATPPEAAARTLGYVLRQAEEAYREGRIPKAETLYLRALSLAQGEERQHCYERLLDIYGQAGRLDRAIRAGLEYESWLRETGQQPRAREVAVLVGRWYLALGDHVEAVKHLRRGLDDRRAAPLTPYWRATGLTHLALAVERQGPGHQKQAVLAWEEVEAFAQGLERLPQDLRPADRIACARGLAECYRFRREREKAVPLLEALLPEYDKAKDWAGRRDTLRLLAGHLLATRKAAEAQKCVQEALQLQEVYAPHDRLTNGDLLGELADALERGGQPEAAERERERAVSEYRAVWEDLWKELPKELRDEPRSRAGALAVFWRLQALHQRTPNYQRALELTEGAAEKWGGPLLRPRLNAERGRLLAILKPGEGELARKLVRCAVKDLEEQSPVNRVELARALLTLGVLELWGGSRAEAKKLGGRVWELYENDERRLPADPVLVETYDLLGSCAALGGDYTEAIEHYGKGTKLCHLLGEQADLQDCRLRLNLAVLYKAQGDEGQALRECREARAIFKRFSGDGAPGLVAFDAAEASMLTTRKGPEKARDFEKAKTEDLKKANTLAAQVLKVCEEKNLPHKDLLQTTALHCQALYHFNCKDFPRAQATWERVRKIQEKQGEASRSLPRTLNYLAITRERNNDLAGAKRLYEEALRLQDAGPAAFPAVQFTTLWRLAELARRAGRNPEARDLLGRAIQVVERARPRIYGEAPERAKYFAQFRPAFQALVEWGVADRDVKSAICAVALGRSRSLMDQMVQAGVDPRKTLPPDKLHLARVEAQLKDKLTALRARAQQSLEEEDAKRLQKEIDKAEEEHGKAYSEMLKASWAYHSIAGQEFTRKELQGLQERVIGRKGVLLVYHVSPVRSFLLALDGNSGRSEAFPLSVPAEVAEGIGDLEGLLARGEDGPRRAVRGLRLRVPPEQTELPGRKDEKVVPLGESVLRDLVDNYLRHVAWPTFSPNRGLRLSTRPGARTLPPQRPELLADVVLPPEARAWVLKARPDCVTVVPDGALHKLPLEGLVIHTKAGHHYILDELPPLVYAPSVAALALLADRRGPARPGPLSLLTVADPAYPQPQGAVPAALRSRRSFLPELPGTKDESKRIIRLFETDQVTKLYRKQATKREVLQALERDRRRIVHLAIHGIPDEGPGGRSAALAFSPTWAAEGERGDDGLLSLDEIYTLPLEGCELAVLSACDTNVGPQPPLEAGVTLAGGFLTAGARRVVASLWEVSDEKSTATLMETFFKEVVAANHRGGPVPFAQALHKARRQVRNVPEWSTPFYWAPFVLIGPAQ